MSAGDYNVVIRSAVVNFYFLQFSVSHSIIMYRYRNRRKDGE